MPDKTVRAFAAVGVIVMLCVLPALGQGECSETFDNFWTGGGAIPIWSDSQNWFEDLGVPDECHNVFIDFPGTTVMDIPGSPHDILSMSVSAGGEFQLGSAGGGTSTLLDVTGSLLSTAPINTHVIRLGQGDIIGIGNVYDWPDYDPSAKTVNFAWEVDGSPGSAYVTVTGTIGQGSWNAVSASIGVGFFAPQQFTLGTPGIIDSGPAPATSPWTSVALWVTSSKAKT